LNKSLLDFLLGSLINKLLVEGNNGLGKSLTDSINLRSVTYFTLLFVYSIKSFFLHTTTLDANSNVNVGETLFTQKKDNFVDLEFQDLRLKELDGRTIDANETMTTLTVGNSGGSFLYKKKT
jgi:hypothetical protein